MHSGRRMSAVLVVVAMVISTAAIGNAPASAAAGGPRIRLIRSTGTVVEVARKGRGFWFDAGVYLAALDAPLEIWVSRPNYDTPMSVTQQLIGGGTLAFPDTVMSQALYQGLARFLEMKITDRNGNVVVDRLMPLCPNAWSPQRIDDSGPVEPTYPEFCGYNPFTLGMVWGIDQGWATNVSDSSGSMNLKLPAGHYGVEFSISPLYTGLLDVAPADAVTSLSLVVKVRHRRDRVSPSTAAADEPASSTERAQRRVPIDTDPDPSTLPDLIPLPSFGIGVNHRGDRDILTFGSNVWVSGASPLVVEGFRPEGASLMDAFQYFYDGDTQVGRAPVGSFEYDSRRGHRHWHFRQFATYSLLAADESSTVVSGKEAFCLGPTDPIDLTLPGAVFRPWPIGLSTLCGGPDALWIREVLPLGWGDTYYQGLPGQAFDITGLPNGTYFIKVHANPGGRLYEQHRGNNVRLREVHLRGRPGHRRVVVPPWHGIDTEGPGGWFRVSAQVRGLG
jgi:hypothetical protein